MIRSRYKVTQPVKPPIPDAPDIDTKPDLNTVRTPAEFARALRQIRDWAGDIPLRELSRRCGGYPSHSSFSNLLRSETKLPPLDLVLVFIDALGLHADRDLWLGTWRRLAMSEGDEQ